MKTFSPLFNKHAIMPMRDRRDGFEKLAVLCFLCFKSQLERPGALHLPFPNSTPAKNLQSIRTSFSTRP
ncbi:hypothetical protein E4U59_004298 [Claviceps monticola]|nr:hypothetical protein E4U59_004298 [Claviceps monticola]